MSVAPFAALADRYGDDLAILWIDSHPDVGTGASEYPGYHAMAVSALVGRADPDGQALLPATVSPDRLALVGLHVWTDDDYPNIAAWGLTSFRPDDLGTQAGRCWTGWPEPAVRGSPSTSTLTRSTATRSCWVSAPNRMG